MKGQSSKIGVVDCKAFYSLRLAAKGFVSNELCREKNTVSVDTKHAISNSKTHAVQDAQKQHRNHGDLSTPSPT